MSLKSFIVTLAVILLISAKVYSQSVVRSLEWYQLNLENNQLLQLAANDALELEKKEDYDGLIHRLELVITSPIYSGLSQVIEPNFKLLRAVILNLLARAYYSQGYYAKSIHYLSGVETDHDLLRRLTQHSMIWAKLSNSQIAEADELIRRLSPTTGHDRLDHEYQVLLLTAKMMQNQLIGGNYIKSVMKSMDFNPPWSHYMFLKVMNSEDHAVTDLLQVKHPLLNPTHFVNPEHLDLVIQTLWILAMRQDRGSQRETLEKITVLFHSVELSSLAENSFFVAAEAFDMLGKKQRSEQIYRNYLKTYPLAAHTWKIRRWLALYALEKADFSASISYLEQYSQTSNPDQQFEARYYQAWIAHRLGEHRQAAESLFGLLKNPLRGFTRDQWLQLLHETAYVLARIKDVKEALAVITPEPFEKPLLASALAQEYLRSGQWQAFLEVFDYLMRTQNFEFLINSFLPVWNEEFGEKISGKMVQIIRNRVIIVAFSEENTASLKQAFYNYAAQLTALPPDHNIYHGLKAVSSRFFQEGDWQNATRAFEALVYHGKDRKDLADVVMPLVEIYGSAKKARELEALLQSVPGLMQQRCCRLHKILGYVGLWKQAWSALQLHSIQEHTEWSHVIRDIYFLSGNEPLRADVRKYLVSNQDKILGQRELAQLSHEIFFKDRQMEFQKSVAEWESRFIQIQKEWEMKRLRDPFWKRLMQLRLILDDETSRKKIALDFIDSNLITIERDAVCELVERNSKFSNSLVELLGDPVETNDKWPSFKVKVQAKISDLEEVLVTQQNVCRRLNRDVLIPTRNIGKVLWPSLAVQKQTGRLDFGWQTGTLGEHIDELIATDYIQQATIFQDQLDAQSSYYISVLERLYVGDIWNAYLMLQQLKENSHWLQQAALWEAAIWLSYGEHEAAGELIPNVKARRLKHWEKSWLQLIEKELKATKKRRR